VCEFQSFNNQEYYLHLFCNYLWWQVIKIIFVSSFYCLFCFIVIFLFFERINTYKYIRKLCSKLLIIKIIHKTVTITHDTIILWFPDSPLYKLFPLKIKIAERSNFLKCNSPFWINSLLQNPLATKDESFYLVEHQY